MRYRGMQCCECDRCGEKEYLTEDAPNQADWHDSERATADCNVRPFLLCSGCYEKYKEFTRQQDAEFAKWMGCE
jgi:hypothetical protein